MFNQRTVKKDLILSHGIETRIVPIKTRESPIPACIVIPSDKTIVANIAVRTIDNLSITVTETVGPTASAW